MMLIYALVVLIGYVGTSQAGPIKKDQKWTYFVFAQEWPPSACLEVPHGKCKIADVVTEWSIHGLWPTSDKGYPSFCNSSMPFNPKTIESLREGLEAKWPNIYADATENSFWKHEWMKHGTCSIGAKGFKNEFDYFKRSLELHDSLNVFEFIRKAGLTPSEDKPILLSYIENAMTIHVNKTTKLFCKNHKEYDYPVLTSMYICLDKELGVIDCDKIDEPVCKKTYVYLLPFQNQQNKNIDFEVVQN